MVLRAWKFADVFPEAAFEAEFFTKVVPDRLHPCDVVMLALLHDDQPAPWSLDTSNRAELDIHTKFDAHDMTENRRSSVAVEADKELTKLARLLIS